MGCGAQRASRQYAPDDRLLAPQVTTSLGETLTMRHSIEEDYTIARAALGKGGFGRVCKGTHKKDNRVRAIKHLPKSSTTVEAFTREVRIWSKLDHPQVILLLACYEDANTYYMVMSMCSGGPLFKAIVAQQVFSERQVSVVMEQVLSGVCYMHQLQICHRDLKPENFMLEEAAAVEDAVIKVVDFGYATEFEKGVKMTASVGTPYYVSPQVLVGSYTEACDVWSIGVLMYIMLCGYPPFNGQCEEDIIKRVGDGHFSFPSPEWDDVSPMGQTLVTNLLKFEEERRFTALQTAKDPWVMRDGLEDRPLQANHLQNLREFSGYSELKKAACLAIARRLRKEELAELRAIFKAMDTNLDGSLTLDEVKSSIDKLPAGNSADVAQDIAELIESFDVNQNRRLDYTEFVAAALDNRRFVEETTLWQAFKLFDADADGKLSRAEIAQALGREEVKDVMGDATVESCLKEVDTGNDGTIDFAEFLTMMKA